MKIRVLMMIAFVSAVMLNSACYRTASATEGGTCPYLPGTRDIFMGGMSAPGLHVREDAIWVVSRFYDMAPRQAFHADGRARAYINMIRLSYFFDKKVLGARWGCGMLLPYAHGNISVRITANGRTIKRMRDSNTGFGDLSIMPVILGWSAGRLLWNAALTLYPPTGEYNRHRIVNIGRNRFAAAPALGVTWYDPKRKQEASFAFNYVFNFENHATNYRSGDQIVVDWGLRQHTAWGFTAGISGYVVAQTTPDRGSGAKSGSFRGTSFAAGPLATYSFKLAGRTVDFIVKYYDEFHVKNRWEGDVLWLSFRTRLF
ncbi:MAG: transporter [Desulfobacterota bacterium]|nr:transporter [Thermodesulfobacteriota bacterium]